MTPTVQIHAETRHNHAHAPCRYCGARVPEILVVDETWIYCSVRCLTRGEDCYESDVIVEDLGMTQVRIIDTPAVPCGYLLQADDGRDMIIQCDYDFPGYASYLYG